MDKYCKACDTRKPISDFGKNKAKRDGLQSQCNECRKTVNADYYRRTPEKNQQRMASKMRMRAAAREYVLSYLQTHPCVDCGLSDIRVLDFDHVRGDKVTNISDMVHRGTLVSRIKDEIDKCEVRCANCHRIVTHERRMGL